MTAEFQAWYDLNCRRMDGTPMQAAWLAWQHLQSARSVAQWRLDATGEQVGDLMPGELNCPPRTTLDILQTQADWRDGQADEIAKEITRQMG